MHARPKGLSIQQQDSKIQHSDFQKSDGCDYSCGRISIRTAELISDLLGWEILIFTARARDEFSSSRQNVHIREGNRYRPPPFLMPEKIIRDVVAIIRPRIRSMNSWPRWHTRGGEKLLGSSLAFKTLFPSVGAQPEGAQACESSRAAMGAPTH